MPVVGTLGDDELEVAGAVEVFGVVTVLGVLSMEDVGELDEGDGAAVVAGVLAEEVDGTPPATDAGALDPPPPPPPQPMTSKLVNRSIRPFREYVVASSKGCDNERRVIKAILLLINPGTSLDAV